GVEAEDIPCRSHGATSMLRDDAGPGADVEDSSAEWRMQELYEVAGRRPKLMARRKPMNRGIAVRRTLVPNSHASRSDDLDVFGQHARRSVGREIVLGLERGQILMHRLLADSIESAVRAIGRPVVSNEEIDDFRWRERILEGIQITCDIQ